GKKQDKAIEQLDKFKEAKDEPRKRDSKGESKAGDDRFHLAKPGSGIDPNGAAEFGMRLELGAVQSAATAGALGDFFQYVIDHSVSLNRQKSAMLPIVGKEIE